MQRPSRAIFAGLVRNCAAMLPSVLANVEAMSAAFDDSVFLFLENGSFDGSRALLQRWARGRAGATVLSPDDTATLNLVRTARLAALRNQIVAEARRRHPAFDVLVLLDCDDVNATPKDIRAFTAALEFLWAQEDRAAVFANSLGAYYDMWALRHATMCPGDIWEMTMDHALAHGVSAEAAFDVVYAPRMFALPLHAPPLEVESAFGGLGIYRLSRVLANRARYDGHKLRTVVTATGPKPGGWQMCEHVSFNAGLRAQGGRLFVLPWLSIGELSELRLSKSWDHALFDPADLAAPARLVAASAETPSRNQACPCGSGQRFKHCHGSVAA